MKKSLVSLSVLMLLTIRSVDAQHHIVIFDVRMPNGYQYLTEYSGEHVQPYAEGEFYRGPDGYHLSFIGGPTDPQRRFVPFVGGRGTLTIRFDPPISFNDLTVDYDDYSSYGSPGLSWQATTVILNPYWSPPPTLYSGTITSDKYPSPALILFNKGNQISLAQLTLSTSGNGDFVVRRIALW